LESGQTYMRWDNYILMTNSFLNPMKPKQPAVHKFQQKQVTQTLSKKNVIMIKNLIFLIFHLFWLSSTFNTTHFLPCIWHYNVLKEQRYSIQINRPTRCNNFSSLLLDDYSQLNTFRASSRPSSGAQQLQ